MFNFPTDYTDFHRFSTPCGVFCCEARYRPLLVREYLCKSVRSVGELIISLAALHTEGAENGSEDGDDEVDDFLNCFLFHFHFC